MRLVFCTSQRVGSRLIRAFTWSDWSHVALVDGGEVIEAVWPEVRAAPLNELLANHAAHAFVDMRCAAPGEVIRAARSQVGKPYDVTALIGMLARRDWQEESGWFCSELVAWAFEQAGTPLFRRNAIHRVTPQHLWMLAPMELRGP